MVSNKNDELNQNVIRCDIGSFVLSVERLKAQAGPVLWIWEQVRATIRWEKPIISLTTFTAACLIAGNNPELLGNILILPLPVCLVLGFFRNVGERKQSTAAAVHAFCRRRDEPPEVLAKKAAIQRAREHLVVYMDILIAIQEFCNDLSDQLESFYNIFNWKRPRLSAFVLVASCMLILLLSVLKTEHLSVFIVCVVFLGNSGFRSVTRTAWQSFRLFVVVNLTALGFPSYSHAGADNDQTNEDIIQLVPSEFRTAENTESSETSDDEIEIPWRKKDSSSSAPAKVHKSGSVVSRLAHYGRQKMKKWSGGNCMSCKVYFSTILKKRQYCRHCGYSFCSKCCHQRVPRAVFGATAPAAYEQTVLVCLSCHDFLVNRIKNKNTEIVE